MSGFAGNVEKRLSSQNTPQQPKDVYVDIGWNGTLCKGMVAKMVKVVGSNSGLIRSAVKRLFSEWPGWLGMPLLGRARQPEKAVAPARLKQRDINKVFYLLLKQAGGKCALFQEQIDDVDEDFVKDFVFVKEESLNGLGPGWVISLRSCEVERVHRVRKRSRKRHKNRAAKAVGNRKNIKVAGPVKDDSESKAKVDAASAVQNLQFKGVTGDGPHKK